MINNKNTVKKYGIILGRLAIFVCTFACISQLSAHGYYGNHTTGTGRDRLMRPIRSYRHWQDQGKMSRWKDSPWFATRDEAFPAGSTGNPSVDRYSGAYCPGGICY